MQPFFTPVSDRAPGKSEERQSLKANLPSRFLCLSPQRWLPFHQLGPRGSVQTQLVSTTRMRVAKQCDCPILQEIATNIPQPVIVWDYCASFDKKC